jgi:cytochrome c-type biogenesis protein CcsB
VSTDALAQWSNTFVSGAMIVLTLTVLVFAVDFAVGSGRRRALQADRERQAARVAGTTGDVGRVAVVPRADAVGDGDPRWARVGVALSVLAFALVTCAVVTRGLSAGRPPWGNMYEFALAGTAAALGTWLFLVRRRPEVRELGVLVTLAALLVLGFAVVVLYTESSELMPALQSYWLWIHVSAAIIASGIFTVGSAASALFLVADRYERRVRDTITKPGLLDAIGKRLPSSQALDRIAYQTIAFAFPLWFFAIVAGAIWAEGAWSRYWGWDPKETWSFITLVIYAAYLHARSTAGWRGRPAAVIALVGYAAFLFSFIGVNIFFFGLHSYSGV